MFRFSYIDLRCLILTFDHNQTFDYSANQFSLLQSSQCDYIILFSLPNIRLKTGDMASQVRSSSILLLSIESHFAEPFSKFLDIKPLSKSVYNVDRSRNLMIILNFLSFRIRKETTVLIQYPITK